MQRRSEWELAWRLPIPQLHRRPLGRMTREDPPVLLRPVDRVDTDRVDRVNTDPADRVDRVNTGPADLANVVLEDPVAQAVSTSAARAARADSASMAQADPHPAGRVVPGVRAGRGTAMPSAATSAGPLGATDPPRGGQANRRDRRGADRYLRPVGAGRKDPSTTGAIRRLLNGIRVSTSGASTSLECGFRCKERTYALPAAPDGPAGNASPRDARCRMTPSLLRVGRQIVADRDR
ncbi:hypothetical protein A5647_15740 [Mycobacterium sp. 1100029.7]|nr:hypothetical protein A5647_15740 [Mycobacterium sp. 1100029.7]